MNFHYGFAVGESIGTIVVTNILFNEWDIELQSIMNYKWVLFDMVLNCLQSFNLNLGNSITNTLSACKAFIFIFSSVY